jgi:hypothetical protein
MATDGQSVEQFLQGLGIGSGEELMSRLGGMQAQIDSQQATFSAQMTQALAQLGTLPTQLPEACYDHRPSWSRLSSGSASPLPPHPAWKAQGSL